MEVTVNEARIRRLEQSELEQVGGGVTLGTGPGGIFSTPNLLAAGRLAGGLGLLYQSYRFGYDLGSYGYNTYINYRYHTR